MGEAVELFERDEQSLAAWEPLVLEALRLRYQKQSTREKIVDNAQRLFRYLAARGVVRWDEVTATLVLEWCRSSRPDSSRGHRRVAESTVKNNQWAANQALTEAAALGAPFHLCELISKNVKRPTDYVSARPLTDDEAELVRTFADPGYSATRRSLAVAFSFAGGSAREVAAVRMRDVDAEHWTVAFRGDAARVCPLDSWGIETVQRHLRAHRPIAADELLCTTKRATARAQSVNVQLSKVVEAAGLKGRPGVSARSIRLTTAHKIRQTTASRRQPASWGHRRWTTPRTRCGICGGPSMADRGAAIFANRKSVPEAELNLRIGDMSVQERQDGPAFEPNPYSSRNTRDATGPRLELSNLEILELFLHHDRIWTMLEEVEAILDVNAPASRPGRRRESGVVDIVLFDFGSWVYGSWQKTHNNLNDPKNWKRLVKATEEAWPDHPQRRLSPKPPTRSKHYRARRSYLNGDLCEVMRTKYCAVAAKTAVEIGMLDPKSGSFTRPAKTQIVQGDATWMPAASKIHRSKAYDPKTGKTRRHDPNADYYHDHTEKKHRAGPGRMLVKIMAHNPHPQERILLDAEFMPPYAHPARKGRNDADFAADMLLRFIEENPIETQGCHGLAYDMAGDSGVKELLQDHGLHGVIKVRRTSSGDYSSVTLGKHDFKAVDGSSFSRTVYAADGSAAVRYVDANGEGVLVELQRMQTKRNRRKNGIVIYSRYKIPDEPVVDQAHIGATTWVRHNSTPEERQAKPHRRRTRALSTIAESDPAFEVYGARQTTESSNSDLKSRLIEKRLRTYTDSDQRLNILTYQMLWLVTAQAAYRRRTTGSPSPQRLPAGEEPIPLAA